MKSHNLTRNDYLTILVLCNNLFAVYCLERNKLYIQFSGLFILITITKCDARKATNLARIRIAGNSHSHC